MRKIVVGCSILGLFAMLWVAPVQAVLTIKITRGIEGALPIAVVPFAWEGGSAGAPLDVADIVAADLRRTGRFAPLPERDLPGRPSDGSQVDFRDWRRLGTENLVVGRLKAQPNGNYQVQFQLFDVFRGVQLTGYSIPSTARDLRTTAHQISDIIYEKLTGDRGAFATRIAYVTQSKGPDGNKRYALEVADSDGYDPQSVLESAQPILSPAWSPDGNKLAYVSFETGQSAIYVQNLATGTRERVAGYPGINGAPAWSPDGRRLAMSLSREGNPEIHILDLDTRRLQRVTYNAAIDTEPAWSPDGRSLVFTSDRGGKPQIYRIAVTGGKAQRLTFEGSYNARASFSPDGARLTMVHGDQGAYRIGLLDLETNALRVLSDARLDESPSFAPNGTMIIYATNDDRGAALAAVSVDGRVHQRLTFQKGMVREPAWSPFSD
ncbi:MAG: Tol-Pal system beta propeller repeat protein TolB [Gammaproteobacteria bacterium]|nr:Tol-Pal system beta propeller repeat protein TolB [Gammaproteobacteria bacterium]